MKRSEMINKLQLFIDGDFPLHTSAEEILDFLESNGMLPPKGWVITNPSNLYYPELKNTKELVNEWELE